MVQYCIGNPKVLMLDHPTHGPTDQPTNPGRFYGNSIVYRNSKLWKIIIWLLCTINCFCLWDCIIWWYGIILNWKQIMTFNHMIIWWLSIIWRLSIIWWFSIMWWFSILWWFSIIGWFSITWWIYIIISKHDVLAPQRACRPVRVQVGGCAEVFRNFYNVKKYYGSSS